MKINNVRIVKSIIEYGNETFNIRNLSIKSGIDYKNAYNILKKLENQNLILLKKSGQVNNVMLIKKVHPLIFQAEYERKDTLISKNKDFKILYKRLNSLKFPFIALIFGSYAKGTASRMSDIDLMIISEKGREKIFEKTINLLPLDIHLVTLTFDEFISMSKINDFNVVSEAIASNILLIGIEDYYRMLEKC